MIDNPELAAAAAVAAGIELAKATSLRSRLDSHGNRMSGDAKEILWAMVFAHEDAAKEAIRASGL